MISQQLLYIYLGIGIFFVLYFFFFRAKPRPPTKLNLRAKPSAEAGVEPLPEKSLPAPERQVDELILPVEEKPIVLEPEALPVPPREGSIFFVYNAHEWESHDVLGLTRGCSLQQATQQYQHLIKVSDPSIFPFYEAAFEAILKKKGSR